MCVCWLGTRKSFDHLISDSKAPKRPEMESGMTTPPKMRRVAENDYEIGESIAQSIDPSTSFYVWCSRTYSMWYLIVVITETQRIGNSHLRKVSVSESNVLLDEEVLTDPKIQALLLTVLVRKHTMQLTLYAVTFQLMFTFHSCCCFSGHPGQIHHWWLWPADSVWVFSWS